MTDFDPDTASADDIMDRVLAIEEDSVLEAEKAYQTVSTIRQIAVDTTVDLQSQSDQIKRIDKDLEYIKLDRKSALPMSRSNRVAECNIPESPINTKLSASSSTTSGESSQTNRDKSVPIEKDSQIQRLDYGSKSYLHDRNQEKIDCALDGVSDGVSDIVSLTNGLKSEIKSQNSQLDRISLNIEKSQVELKRKNADIDDRMNSSTCCLS